MGTMIASWLSCVQFDGTMQGQAQAAAASGMALRYVGSLDLVNRKCSVALKVSQQLSWHGDNAPCILCMLHHVRLL